MSAPSEGFMAVALTRDEARVWETGVGRETRPEVVHAPREKARHHHLRPAPHQHMHGTDLTSPAYFESITAAVASASSILLIGHGKGKANEMLRLTQYWERHHPDVAAKVVGAIDSDLEALTENQVLALARDWFDEYHEFI